MTRDDVEAAAKPRVTIDGKRYIPVDHCSVDEVHELRDMIRDLQQELSDARVEIVAGRSVRDELAAENAQLRAQLVEARDVIEPFVTHRRSLPIEREAARAFLDKLAEGDS